MQHRSYFALHLPNNWWIWAYDSQLGEDIDAPQANYFVQVAKKMVGQPRVILCASAPTWLKAQLKAKGSEEQRDIYHRALHYIADDILNCNCPKARVLAVLSGDLHHYSRYSSNETGTQFITAGGGGAFLHPTHQLEDEIEAVWVRKKQTLSLKTTPDAAHTPSDQEACYPMRWPSRWLALGNWKFPWVNPQFCLALGVIYWLALQVLILGQSEVFSQAVASGPWAIASSVASSPIFMVLSLALLARLYVYSDAKTRWLRLILAAIHGVFHIALILLLVSLLPPFNEWLAGWSRVYAWPQIFQVGTISNFLLFAGEVVLIGGFVGGLIWGLYLLFASCLGALHYNHAFSAMRIEHYKHFLRLRITKNELTIYPVALDRVPGRKGWLFNRRSRTDDQNQPVIIPKEPLRPHLIEGAPVVIRVPDVKSMNQAAEAP